jgi:hypothetical protein
MGGLTVNAAETQARAMNRTQRRMYLLDHGWTKGRDDQHWSHPKRDGSYTLPVAVRLALGEETQ